MNRRLFAAGSMGLFPVAALAQKMTPEPAHEPGSVLRRYLNEVWIKRNADAIADFFDAESVDLQAVWRDHEIAIDGLDPDQALTIHAITSDATTAMSYNAMRMEKGDVYDMFVIVHVSSDGLITAYRWMAQPAD